MKIQWVNTLLLFNCIISIQFTNNTIKIKELGRRHNLLLAEKKNINKLLNKNQKLTENTLYSLVSLNKQIAIKNQLIKTLKNGIVILRKNQNNEKLISQLGKNLQLKKEYYAIAIQKMYQQKNNQRQLFFTLSANNITQLFHQILYLMEYAKWRKAQGEEIIAQQNIEIKKKQILDYKIQEKVDLINIEEKEKIKLELQEKIKKTEIENLNENTKKLQAELDIKKRQAEVLNKEIAKIYNGEITKKTTVTVKAEQKTETANNYTSSNEEQYLSTNFANNKGKIRMPLEGEYRIISQFGRQQYNNIKNVYYNNNGIDIETTQGNTARSVFDGIVTEIDSNGNEISIIIRHENYLTLYSNIDQLFVRKGEKVKTGQSIGRIYTNKANKNSTVLHFEIWKELDRLNPKAWLCQ